MKSLIIVRLRLMAAVNYTNLKYNDLADYPHQRLSLLNNVTTSAGLDLWPGSGSEGGLRIIRQGARNRCIVGCIINH